MGVTPGVLLAALLVLIGLHGIVIAVIVISIVLPNPIRQLRDHGPPEAWGLTPERSLVGDGSPAWYFPNPTATHAVLVCHGRSRNKAWMLPMIARLAPDYAVFAFDFPSHGDQRYGTTTMGIREAETVRHALDWLRRRGHDRVFVFGVSMGGAAAILSLGDHPSPAVEGLATDGTFDEFGHVLDNVARRLPLPSYLRRVARSMAAAIVGVDPDDVRPVLAAPDLTMPALFLHGDRDPLVPSDSARALAVATPNGTAHLYPGEHDQPDNPALQDALTRFFAELADRPTRDDARATGPVAEGG